MGIFVDFPQRPGAVPRTDTLAELVLTLSTRATTVAHATGPSPTESRPWAWIDQS